LFEMSSEAWKHFFAGRVTTFALASNRREYRQINAVTAKLAVEGRA
jgi:hypothetical protein